jgi:CheY-like chemotaxis protein
MLATSASTAPEALHLLAKRSFDIALIDYQMPDMNGVALAREIRKTVQIPLVLLSSSGEVITGEDALLFQAQVLKPLKHALLFSAILRLTGAKRSDPQPVPAKRFDAELAVRIPLRILLAEDNLTNQKVGLKMLSRFGYTADLAGNGQQAAKIAAESTYDLVLMDIQMPEMGGIESLRVIRLQQGAKCPFIVALTAEALEGDRERFLGLGFDDYLTKLLKPGALREMLLSVSLQLAVLASPLP